jgi:hypothetical protein
MRHGWAELPLSTQTREPFRCQPGCTPGFFWPNSPLSGGITYSTRAATDHVPWISETSRTSPLGLALIDVAAAPAHDSDMNWFPNLVIDN